jgi:hypothetical protein
VNQVMHLRVPENVGKFLSEQAVAFLQYVSHNMKIKILQNITFMCLPIAYTIRAQFIT